MKYINLILSVCFLICSIAVNAQPSEAEPGQLLVQIPDERKALSLTTDLRTLNGVNTRLEVADLISPPMNIYLLTFDETAVDADELLRAVKHHPGVSIAQFNHRVYRRETVPNDPQFSQQWHHVNTGAGNAIADADIDSDLAWDITTGGTTALGDEIVVCVIEGGNLNHPDLVPNKWVNTQEIPGNGIDDDGNGYVDDYNGWNVASNSDNGVFQGGHGTQVMGMIGARGDNNLGVAGANWNVKIMSVAGESLSNEASVVAAYTYPLVMRQLYNETNGAQGAFVVATNASWGLDGANPNNHPLWCAVYDTLGEHGILSCGATSNSNVNVDVVGDMPTACASPYMVAVTATNNRDERTFSGYGIQSIDVGAPGSSVHTTSGNNGYGSATGTSFASPLTAGVIALLYSAPCPSLMQIIKADPQLGADMIRNALFEGVDIVPNLLNEVATGGRINAYNSLMHLLDNCSEAGCLTPFSINITQEENTANYTFSWSGLDPVSYDLRYRPVGNDEWIEVSGLSSESYFAPDLFYCTDYELQIRANCDDESSEYSVSVEWTTDGCCENPELMVGAISASSTTISWSSVLSAESFNLRYRLIGTVAWTEIDDIITTEYTLNDLTECSGYEVQIQTICNDDVSTEYSESVLFNTTGCGACQDLDYCPSGGQDSSEEWIQSVVFSGFSNISGNNGGYADFTGEAHYMLKGEPQTFTLTPGFSGNSFPERFRIWIDYNQDGEFASNELVYDSGSGSSSAVSGSFTVPESALVGSTRMRISMKYVGGIWSEGPPPTVCENYSYGETEDYCVYLDEATSVLETDADQTFNLFPNPARDVLTIELGDESSNLSYRITDMTGRMVAHGAITGSRRAIDLNTLAPGSYSLTLMNVQGQVATQQFIKTK